MLLSSDAEATSADKYRMRRHTTGSSYTHNMQHDDDAVLSIKEGQYVSQLALQTQKSSAMHLKIRQNSRNALQLIQHIRKVLERQSTGPC